MKHKKDILQILEEAQELAQKLCSEKADLGEQIKKIEPELSKLRAQQTQLTQTLQTQTELSQEVQTLQASQAQLTKELQEAKTQLAQARQAPPPKPEPTKVEAELSKLRAEKTQEIWHLQEINAQVMKELEDAKTHLARALQTPPAKTGDSQELQALQANQVQLAKELQETKAQLIQARQAPPPSAESTKELQKLQASQAHLTKELQETKAQLAQVFSPGHEKTNSLSAENQELQEKLKHAELQNHLLEREMSKQCEEIQTLETRLREDKSLASSSSTIE